MPPKKAPVKKAAKKPAKGKAVSAPKSGGATKPASARTAERDERQRRNVDMSGPWPVDADTGLPLVQISFTASELIPTGEYANVCVGPVTVTKFIRDPEDDDELVEEMNNLAELVEAGCISEQRENVLKSLQDDVS